MTKQRLALALGVALIGAACGGGTSVSTAGSFCELAEEREEAETEFFETSDLLDPGQLQEAFDLNRDLLERAIDLAPDELEADLELVQADLQNTYDFLDEAEWDFTVAFGADIEELPGAEEAGQRVDDYIRENCGLDPDANDPTDAQIGEQLEESGRSADLVREALVQAGFSEDQASCLAERISFEEFTAAGSGTVPDQLLARFEECGVDLGTLAELGGADPEDLQFDVPQDIPQEGIDLFVDEMVNQGFTEDEARCIGEAMFLSESPGDPFAAFEECDIPLSRLQEPGGG